MFGGFGKMKNISIGKFSYGLPEVLTWFKTDSFVSIGNYTSIATGCKIILNGEHRVDWVTTYPFRRLRKKWKEASDIVGHPMSKGNVIIENDVWIGQDTTILSGVTISNGSVVGIKSLVTKDVPPYCIVGGIPAKIIKKRFSDDIIEELLKIQWWNWPEKKVRENIKLLSSDRIEEFVKKFSTR